MSGSEWVHASTPYLKPRAAGQADAWTEETEAKVPVPGEAADLRDEIMTGSLAPGANLPSTQRLKERFPTAAQCRCGDGTAGERHGHRAAATPVARR